MYPGTLNSAFASGQGLSPLSNAVREVFSAEILYTALPLLRFEQFAARRTELGTQPGNTIRIMKAGSLRKGTQLVEGVRIKANPMTTSLVSLTVYEHGNAIGFTEFLVQTAFFDVFMMASILLGRDLATVLDMQLRDSAFGTTNVTYAGGQTSRGAVLATDIMSTVEIKDAVETLETNLAPKFGADHYVGFLHPHQARGLRDDSAWINAAHYAYQGAGAENPVYLGEIGRYEDTRFVSTTMCPNGANATVDPFTGDFVDMGHDTTLDNAGDSNTDIYQSVIFGENYYAFAVGLDPEMRDDGVTDFGREHALAWYSIWGRKVLENANGVVIETA